MLAARPRNSIHIKNLPDTINYNDVWLEFRKHGEIVNVTIPTDITTGKAKGYAFVDYQSPEDAAKAISSMNGVRLWGHILTIEYSRSFPKTSREMALRALNATRQGGVLWPQMPLVARTSVPIAVPRRRSSHTRDSSYSSRYSVRSHSSCRSGGRRGRRHYSSELSSCYSSSSRSTSCSRSSTRSRSYHRRRRHSRRHRRDSYRRRDSVRRSRKRYRRKRDSVSSYDSRSRSRSFTNERYTNRPVRARSKQPSLGGRSVHRSPSRSSKSYSEGEVTDFVEENFEPCKPVSPSPKNQSHPTTINGACELSEPYDDIPDSLVIQANLIRSPPASEGSVYSISTRSSRGSSCDRRVQPVKHRQSPTGSVLSPENSDRSSRCWDSDS